MTKGCPDCDARQKYHDDILRAAKEEEEARRRSDERSNAYLAGIVGGGLTVGMPAAWLHDWLGGPSVAIPAMVVGIILGVLWVYWRGDKFGTGR